jgi:hypothetical protein
MASKAQLKKLQDALKKAEANLAKVQDAVAAPRAATIAGPLGGLGAGVIAGVNGGQPATTVAPVDNLQTVVGPLGGLGAGVVAGVSGPDLEAERATALAKAAADKAAADKAAADAEAAAAVARTKAEIDAANAAKEAALVAQAKAEKDAAAARAEIERLKSLPQATPPATPPSNTPVLDSKKQDIIATLTDRFSRYKLEGLIPTIKKLATEGATEATITLELQGTDTYKERFKANDIRIKKGLSVLTPAEYLNVEDGYRQVLRAYGLKQFDTDAYVQQFIGNDVSPTEFSNRVVTAVQRVQNADPAISKQLRDFYGIGQTDLVAYALDPEQNFQKIERQVAAAEIGVAAARQGITAGVSVAEQLAAQGVTQAEAQKGYATIADILPTAGKLSEIYGTTMDTYGQAEAEQETFNSLASAQRKRQALTAREVAQFSGASGTNKASLASQTRGQI